ncbi:MAG: hypothetical protein LBV00_07085 [Propionibacteriaceae bacterium]|jgi:non-ribosomal peptide synthetase component F|nr:hypothetical protein [Propionibacteriaceae bacterium]
MPQTDQQKPPPDSRLTQEEEQYYWGLDAAAEQGELLPDETAGPILSGREAQAQSHRMLMWATETTTIEDAVAVALGRPRLSAQPNETLKVRTPRPLAEGLRQFARQHGSTVSQVARTAWQEFLERHDCPPSAA